MVVSDKMVVSAMIPSGLDGCWGGDDFQRIEQYAKQGGAIGRSKAEGLTGLVGLKALANFVRHLTAVVGQFPVAAVVELGRLVGVNAAKNSIYDLKRVALHVLRAFQQAMLALGSLLGFCILLPLAKPLFAVSLHHGLRLDRPLETGAAVQTWRARLEGYCGQAQGQAKKVWQSTRDFYNLVVSNKNPTLTKAVVGGLAIGGATLAGLAVPAGRRSFSSHDIHDQTINNDPPPSGINPVVAGGLTLFSLVALAGFTKKRDSNVGIEALWEDQ